mmetsp:Transcript_14183/g.17572  ORF Transcript_14183/g.17572 Transcript_14183/m.17572 type:complete len:94 (-) Transcript_14183:271-552(-)
MLKRCIADLKRKGKLGIGPEDTLYILVDWLTIISVKNNGIYIFVTMILFFYIRSVNVLRRKAIFLASADVSSLMISIIIQCDTVKYDTIILNY